MDHYPPSKPPDYGVNGGRLVTAAVVEEEEEGCKGSYFHAYDAGVQAVNA
jgi:hypothetical protein